MKRTYYGGYRISYYGNESFYCMGYEEDVELTEITRPGYYCGNFERQYISNKAEIVETKTKMYIATLDKGLHQYCNNNHTILQKTPKITQEPCQRLRIRVVYALVQTIIE